MGDEVDLHGFPDHTLCQLQNLASQHDSRVIYQDVHVTRVTLHLIGHALHLLPVCYVTRVVKRRSALLGDLVGQSSDAILLKDSQSEIDYSWFFSSVIFFANFVFREKKLQESQCEKPLYV